MCVGYVLATTCSKLNTYHPSEQADGSGHGFERGRGNADQRGRSRRKVLDRSIDALQGLQLGSAEMVNLQTRSRKMILRPRLILRPSVGFHFFFFWPWSVLPRITWLPGGIPADIRHTLLTIMTTNNQRVNVRVRLGSWIISTVQKGGKSTLTGFCRIGVPEFPSKPEAAMPPTQFSHDYATGDCRAGSGGPLGRRTCSTWGFASWYQSFERGREREKSLLPVICVVPARDH